MNEKKKKILKKLNRTNIQTPWWFQKGRFNYTKYINVKNNQKRKTCLQTKICNQMRQNRRQENNGIQHGEIK
jgi:hypothetical protein